MSRAKNLHKYGDRGFKDKSIMSRVVMGLGMNVSINVGVFSINLMG